jgi:hypothetical protein
MQGSDDRTILPFRNAFTRPFLDQLGEVDEPPTAGEADVAGPWEVEEILPRGYGHLVFQCSRFLNRSDPRGWIRKLQEGSDKLPATAVSDC